MQETQILALSQKIPLEKEMTTRPSILAEKSHGQRSLGGYSSPGHSLVTKQQQHHHAQGCSQVCPELLDRLQGVKVQPES